MDERWHYIAEASLVYHTPIGPVSLALTKYDLRNWKNMYLTFNFGYAIFAPRGRSISVPWKAPGALFFLLSE